MLTTSASQLQCVIFLLQTIVAAAVQFVPSSDATTIVEQLSLPAAGPFLVADVATRIMVAPQTNHEPIYLKRCVSGIEANETKLWWLTRFRFGKEPYIRRWQLIGVCWCYASPLRGMCNYTKRTTSA